MGCQDHSAREAPSSMSSVTVFVRPPIQPGASSSSLKPNPYWRSNGRPSGLTAEEEKAFIAQFEALRKSQSGSKKFIRDHPICDTCHKLGKPCIVYKGVSCTSCHKRHQACPRPRAFYAQGMSGFRDGMTEDESLRILFALGNFTVKPRGNAKKKMGRGSSKRDLNRRRRTPSPADDDSHSGNEEDTLEENPVDEEGQSVEPEDAKAVTEELESRIRDLEDEVSRFEGLLAAKEQEKESDSEDEGGKLEKRIHGLEEQLEREKQESGRLRAALKKHRGDSVVTRQSGEQSTATQQNLTFLAQIGLYASSLRTQERKLREDQGADTREVASVIARLQTAVDGAVAREHEGMLKMPGVDATVVVARTSTPKGKKRRYDIEEEDQDDEEPAAQVGQSRDGWDSKTRVGGGGGGGSRSGPDGNESRSTSKRVRVSDGKRK